MLDLNFTGKASHSSCQPHLGRSAQNAEVRTLYERVNNIARGAALMTGTSVEIDFIKACSNTVLNDTLQRLSLK